jgi:hypothetical protein
VQVVTQFYTAGLISRHIGTVQIDLYPLHFQLASQVPTYVRVRVLVHTRSPQFRFIHIPGLMCTHCDGGGMGPLLLPQSS